MESEANVKLWRKNGKLNSFMIILLATSILFAQDFASQQERVAIPEDAQFHQDGSYSFRTFDPHGNDVTVVVEPRLPNLPDLPRDNPAHPDFVRETDAMDQVHAKPGGGNGGGGNGQVTINVYAFADEEYRSAYSNWQKKIGSIIEKADNAYGRDQNINWVVVGYYEWNSNGRSASQLLSDLSSESNGVGNGLVMGFTADPNFEAGGIAYVYNSNPGTGVSVCVDQGNTWTTYALRHEIGHNYGCYHDFDPVVCLMNYTHAYSIDYFDSDHECLISSHRNWFQ